MGEEVSPVALAVPLLGGVGTADGAAEMEAEALAEPESGADASAE